jgi:hypothetical protein
MALNGVLTVVQTSSTPENEAVMNGGENALSAWGEILEIPVGMR